MSRLDEAADTTVVLKLRQAMLLVFWICVVRGLSSGW